jgi:hypothetical protein
MTATYSVKELIAHVAAGTIKREDAIAHCNAVLARPTTSENKAMRWTRVRDAFAKAEPITVKAAFATMAEAKPAKASKPAKAKSQPKAEVDPMTALAKQMEALTAAFVAMAKAKR